MIESQNYMPNVSGFQIKSDGNAEFNDVRIRGSAIFDSEIFSGPLYLSKEAPRSVTITIIPSTDAPTIAKYLRSGVLALTGQYNGIAINRLRLDTQTSSTGDQYDNTTTTHTRIYARYVDNTETLIAHKSNWIRIRYEPIIVGSPPNMTIIPNFVTTTGYTNHSLTAYYLWFNYIEAGFTMKLINIPDYEPEESGTVYRNGNVLMIK